MLTMLLMAAEAPKPKAAVDDRPGIAALDLVAVKGVESAVARLLNEAMLSRLKSSGRFSSVLGSSDLKAMLSMEQQKAVLGCGDENCLAELGGALGVPLLFSADVGVVGGRFMLNLKILKVDEARVADRRTTIYADEGELLEGWHAAIDTVILGALGEEVSARPPEALQAPAASAAEKATANAPPQAKGARKWWLGGSTLTLGALVAAGGWLYFDSEQQQFNTVEDRQSDDFERLDQAQTVANSALGVGAGVLVLGGWLLW
jgi:hypothetical protein